MGAFTDFMEGKIVDAFLRGAGYAYTGGNVYLGLFTAEPTDVAASGTECSYTGYTRQLITFGALTAGQTKNGNVITFGANQDVGAVTVGWIAVFDAVTLGTGNRLLYAPLTTSKILAQNDVLAFAAESCIFTLD